MFMTIGADRRRPRSLAALEKEPRPRIQVWPVKDLPEEAAPAEQTLQQQGEQCIAQQAAAGGSVVEARKAQVVAFTDTATAMVSSARGAEDLQRAAEYLRAALALDPGNSAARSALSHVERKLEPEAPKRSRWSRKKSSSSDASDAAFAAKMKGMNAAQELLEAVAEVGGGIGSPFKELLARQAAEEINTRCFDCSQPLNSLLATWVSTSYGVYVCLQCIGIHRGNPDSRAKSLGVDTWNEDDAKSMLVGGNLRALAALPRVALKSRSSLKPGGTTLKMALKQACRSYQVRALSLAVI